MLFVSLMSFAQSSLYIEPFSIAPGEQKQIEVLLDNPGEVFTQLQFNLALPEGIEIVFDEDNFCDMIDCGSRLSSKAYSIETNHKDGYVQILGITTNKNAYIKGESGDVLLITVQAADDIADGVYDLSINNVVLSHQDGSTVKAASTTAAITVSSTTGLTNIEGAEGSDVYYDLQGRAVEDPAKGIYIVNDKKVLVK